METYPTDPSPGSEQPSGAPVRGQPTGRPPPGSLPPGERRSTVEEPPQYPPPTVGTSGFAVTSLVLGVVGVVLFVLLAIPSILAIVFGVLALRRIGASRGLQRGRGMAIAGIALGAIETVVFVLALAFGNYTFEIGSRTLFGSNSYDANGVKFSYPDGWQERSDIQFTASEGQGSLFDAGVMRNEHEGLILTAYRLRIPVTEDNLEQVRPELEALVDQLAQSSGAEILAGPEPVEVGGMPGYLWTIDTATPDGTEVESQLHFVFRGTTEYLLTCQYTDAGASETRAGCREILDSFETG